MSYLSAFGQALPAPLLLADLSPLATPELWAQNPAQAAASALAARGLFDADDYLRRYPDVAASGMDPIRHFCRHGLGEGRTFRARAAAPAAGGQPLVSVVIPVYNNARYLRECFQSVIDQTLRDLEIIIVDDGSSDPQAIAIMAEYAASDARVRLLRQRNAGYGRAMNVGMDAATGKYMAIVESDDYILPEMCEYYYDLAEAHQLDFVKSDFRRFFGAPAHRIFEDVALFGAPFWYDRVLDPWRDEDMREYIPKYVVIWNGLYNLAFLRRYKIRFNETPGAAFQDNGFYFQTFIKASRCMTTQKAMYMLRRDNMASSIFGHGKADVMRKEYQFIYDKLFGDARVHARFIKYFQYARFEAYMFNIWRVRHELRAEILAKYQEDYSAALAANELDPTWFNEKYELARQLAAGTFARDAFGRVELSVLLPGGLDRRQLHNCLRAIQQQEVKDLEIICVENGEYPDAYAHLRAEAEKDVRIKVFYQAGGESLATILNSARGEYVLLWQPGVRVYYQLFGDLLWLMHHCGCDLAIVMDPGRRTPEKPLYNERDFAPEQLAQLQGALGNAMLRKSYAQAVLARAGRGEPNLLFPALFNGKLSLVRKESLPGQDAAKNMWSTA